MPTACGTEFVRSETRTVSTRFWVCSDAAAYRIWTEEASAFCEAAALALAVVAALALCGLLLVALVSRRRPLKPHI